MNNTQLTRRQQGLCPYCGQEPAPGKTMCEKHLDIVNARSREYSKRLGVKPHIQKQRRAEGLCPYCGQEPVSGRAMCAEHLAKESQRSAEYQKLNGYKNATSSRKKRKEWWKELKRGKSCMYCGETSFVCLDFHHRDPSQKLFNIAFAYGRKGRTKEEILAEIEKCDVVCANCHRRLHWGEEDDDE